MKKMFVDNILKILTGIVGVIAALVVVLGAGYIKAPPADLSLGAVSGNEVQGNQFIVGGLKTYKYGESFFATTTSVCSFKSPNATTTLVSASGQTTMSDVNKLGATIIRLGIHLGSNNWASTTRIAGETVLVGNNAAVTATSSWLSAAGAVLTTPNVVNKLIAPNTFVNFQIEGTSSPTTGGLSGKCSLFLMGLD